MSEHANSLKEGKKSCQCITRLIKLEISFEPCNRINFCTRLLLFLRFFSTSIHTVPPFLQSMKLIEKNIEDPTESSLFVFPVFDVKRSIAYLFPDNFLFIRKLSYIYHTNKKIKKEKFENKSKSSRS